MCLFCPPPPPCPSFPCFSFWGISFFLPSFPGILGFSDKKPCVLVVFLACSPKKKQGKEVSDKNPCVLVVFLACSPKKKQGKEEKGTERMGKLLEHTKPGTGF